MRRVSLTGIAALALGVALGAQAQGTQSQEAQSSQGAQPQEQQQAQPEQGTHPDHGAAQEEPRPRGTAGGQAGEARPRGMQGRDAQGERTGRTAGDACLGNVRIAQRVVVGEQTLAPGTYELCVRNPAGPVGTTGGDRGTATGAAGTGAPAGGDETAAAHAPAGPWVEFVQGEEVKARAMAIVTPAGKRAAAGARAQRVRNDDDPYVRISARRGGQTYLLYLPAEGGRR